MGSVPRTLSRLCARFLFPTIAKCRYLLVLSPSPKVGAVCGSSARTDLCGGRGVIPVPTASLHVTDTKAEPISPTPHAFARDPEVVVGRALALVSFHGHGEVRPIDLVGAKSGLKLPYGC